MTAEPHPAPAAHIVRCPTCNGDSVFSPANPHRPFCSERCRRVDLGAWASERYRVADHSPPVENASPPPESTD